MTIQTLIQERKELAELAARIVESMRNDVQSLEGKGNVNRQVVKMTRIIDLSPEEQAKVIRMR